MKITLLQTTIPAYRQGVIDLLGEYLGDDLEILGGSEYFEPTVRLGVSHPKLHVIRNRFIAGRRLLWQSKCWRPVLQADVAVMELNPRVISSWLFLIGRRLRGRRTVLWGHAWPRRGPKARSEPIRRLMTRLASHVMAYTETEATELKRKMPSASISSAPNALYRLDRRGPAWSSDPPEHVVFVGRLVEAKKPELLLRAFVAALDELPETTCLVFVGDGQLRGTLEEEAKSLTSSGRVRFVGEITSFEGLRDVYGTALVSVSPGYVGLSLIQSLWFGVPAIIARDEPHSPEIEAADEGKNCVFSESDSITDLRRALVQVLRGEDSWLARREEIAQACAARYSLETMVSAMVAAIYGRVGDAQSSAVLHESSPGV